MQVFRFSAGVRAFHWSVAVPVLLLLCSGLTMTAQSFGLLSLLSKQALLSIHTGLAYLLPFLPLLVLFVTDRHMVKKEIVPAFQVNESDLQWGVSTFRNVFNKDIEITPAAKFNGGQKMNAIMSLLWISILCISGFVMLVSKGNVLAHLVHVGAIVMFVPGLLVHLFMATLNPSTRCSLGGMFHGYVPDYYLKHHHGLYFKTFGLQIIDDLFVSPLTRKKDRQYIFRQVYEKDMDRGDFMRLKAGSEAFIGVWQGERLGLFFRVVGDGQRLGFIVDLHDFGLRPDPEVMERIVRGAEDLVGHPLRLPLQPEG